MPGGCVSSPRSLSTPGGSATVGVARQAGSRGGATTTAAMAAPNAAQTTNVPRHGMTLISPAPSAGATTGTMMKIVIANDISRAMSSPPNRSRIVATAMTRSPAAPTPQTNRAHSIQRRLGTAAAASAPPTNSAQVPSNTPRRPKRSAKKTERDRPQRHAEEERRDQSGGRRRIGCQSEVGANSAERRQDQIDRDGRRRHRQTGEGAQLEA